jgi:hypothetical protein
MRRRDFITLYRLPRGSTAVGGACPTASACPFASRLVDRRSGGKQGRASRPYLIIFKGEARCTYNAQH